MFYHRGCSRSKGISKASPETPKGKAQWSGTRVYGTDGKEHLSESCANEPSGAEASPKTLCVQRALAGRSILE